MVAAELNACGQKKCENFEKCGNWISQRTKTGLCWPCGMVQRGLNRLERVKEQKEDSAEKDGVKRTNTDKETKAMHETLDAEALRLRATSGSQSSKAAPPALELSDDSQDLPDARLPEEAKASAFTAKRRPKASASAVKRRRGKGGYEGEREREREREGGRGRERDRIRERERGSGDSPGSHRYDLIT